MNLHSTLKHCHFYTRHRLILNKCPSSDSDSVSLHLRVNSESLRSHHKDFFVFSIHTSGHEVVSKAQPNISFSQSFLCHLKYRYGTCSAYFETESIEHGVLGERCSAIKVFMMDREELFTQQRKE